MARVIVFGTFDYLHPGHANYLQQAASLGNELIVIVARDSNVSRIKGHNPKQNEKIRLNNLNILLKKLPTESKAVLGHQGNIWLVLNEYRPDIIALGYDQRVNEDKLRAKLEEFGLNSEIKRLRPYHPEKYKSSLMNNERR